MLTLMLTLRGRTFSLIWLVRVVAIATMAATLCGYLDHFTQVFEPLEQRSYGERLEVSARVNRALVRQVQNQIVLVTFSDTSAEWAARRHSPGPLLPRSYQAALIRELTHYGAKVIVFDYLFDTPQPGDADLAAAMRQSGRVLLACADADEGQTKILFPEQHLRDTGAHFGHTRIPVSADRPAIDRMTPVVTEGNQSVPALSVEALLMASGQPGLPLKRMKQSWQADGLTVPIDADGTFKIRYLGSSGETFPPIPYELVVAPTPAQRAFFEANSTFRNKIVIVGDSTLISNDSHLTPLGIMPGVEIHAYALATLLGGRFLHDASDGAEVVQTLLLAVLSAFLASSWRLRRAALSLLLVPAYFLFNVWMFVERDFVLHLVAPSATIIVTLVGVLLDRGLAEEREKTQMRDLLMRYVSPQIAGYLLQHPELLGRKGKRVTGTVLFSDIRGFTALSERLPPEELVARMNEYFQAITDIIFRHDGTAVCMIGDAMLAVFGVPVPYPDHACRAVSAAIEMQTTLEDLQEKWHAQSRNVFDIGIGINTGEMVVGDVGGQHLMNFTVYGLQVNIASRVEAENKRLGSRTLITRSTYQALEAQSRRLRVRGPISVALKGVEGAVEVFELLGWQTVPDGP